MLTKHLKNATATLLAETEYDFEGSAVDQLYHSAGLCGIKRAVALPDLHPGRGIPVGAAFFSQGRIYPHLIGNDIGCGIGLWQSTLKHSKFKVDKAVRKLSQADTEVETNSSTSASLGGGNHFIELQQVEEILLPQEWDNLALDARQLFVLVHSGSRWVGEQVYRHHIDACRAVGFDQDDRQFEEYLSGHDEAMAWAKNNRQQLVTKFLDRIDAGSRQVLDNTHNSVSPCELDGVAGWLHRKGAAAADQGILVIPGSRGSLSYLVKPLGCQQANLWSLPHGAGRKWNRSSCKARLKDKFSARMLRHTGLGSIVICDDGDLLYEEAPQAYKNIEKIISYIVGAGLVEVIASFRPVLTYKQRL